MLCNYDGFLCADKCYFSRPRFYKNTFFKLLWDVFRLYFDFSKLNLEYYNNFSCKYGIVYESSLKIFTNLPFVDIKFLPDMILILPWKTRLRSFSDLTFGLIMFNWLPCGGYQIVFILIFVIHKNIF
jgi:hypothetical protein